MTDVLPLDSTGRAPLKNLPASPQSPRLRSSYDNPVMATPPTITSQAGNASPGSATSSISGGSLVTPETASTPLRLNGPFVTKFFGNCWAPRMPIRVDGTHASYANSASWSIDFDYFGSKFEVLLFAATSIRVLVNDQYVSTTPVTTANDSQWHNVLVDFTSAGGVGYRRIRVELSGAGPYLGGIRRQADGALAPPSIPAGKSFAIVGDSYAQGGGGSVSSMYSYAPLLARMLGFSTFYNLAAGGTGYLGAGSAATYGGRLPDLVAIQPDYCFVQGTVNDDLLTANLRPAVDAYIAAAVSACPNTQFVFGGVVHLGNPSGSPTNTGIVSAAAAAAGVKFIDTTGWSPLGTGNAGSVVGDGPADYLTASDDLHPTQAGGEYLARRYAPELARHWALSI